MSEPTTPQAPAGNGNRGGNRNNQGNPGQTGPGRDDGGGAPPVAAAQPEPSRVPGIGEIEVEFADKRNRSKMWPPTRNTYRGAWNKANLIADERSERIEQIPDIPGVRLYISPERKQAIIFDPLSQKENADQCRGIADAIKTQFGSTQGPMETVKYPKLTPSDVKTWLYWLRRMLDNNDIRVITGSVPEMEAIEALPGQTEMGAFDSSPNKCRFRENFGEYMEVVTRIPRRLTQ